MNHAAYEAQIQDAVIDSVLGGFEDFNRTDDGFAFAMPEGEGTIKPSGASEGWTVTLPDGRTATHTDPLTAINNAVEAINPKIVPADASRDDLITALVAMRTGDELEVQDAHDPAKPWRVLLMHGRRPATAGNLESFYFIDGQDGENPVVCANAHEAADWITA